jgi:hypothetical protein
MPAIRPERVARRVGREPHTSGAVDTPATRGEKEPP